MSGKVTAFVGDGTNDALAMREATVSIALGNASDEALTACGFVSLNSDLGCLKELFVLGKKLSKVIRANYIWAFAFNGFFIPVAALGKLVPLAAMLLMLVSSTAVLLNSLRLKKG
jgi:P-type E1-E2 ATPase